MIVEVAQQFHLKHQKMMNPNYERKIFGKTKSNYLFG